MVWSARIRSDEQESEKLETDEQVSCCTECGSENIVSHSGDGERICDDCGLIIEEMMIDSGPEWRAFTHQEQQERSRVGAPITQSIHDKGLTTQIDWKDKDANGRSLSSKKRAQMNRLRKWQNRIRTNDTGERNLQFALSEIDRMASALGVPKGVREVTSVIYRRALREDLIRGRSIEGVATAALYAGCRQEGLPRSLEEIAVVSRVKKLKVSRAYRYLSRELGLELMPVDPRQYVPRFSSELDLPQEVVSKANEIIDATADPLLSGRGPSGFAAAAIYAAALLCNQKRTQSEVAEVAQVTEVTIRNRYREQIEMFDPQ